MGLRRVGLHISLVLYFLGSAVFLNEFILLLCFRSLVGYKHNSYCWPILKSCCAVGSWMLCGLSSEHLSIHLFNKPSLGTYYVSIFMLDFLGTKWMNEWMVKKVLLIRELQIAPEFLDMNFLVLCPSYTVILRLKEGKSFILLPAVLF